MFQQIFLCNFAGKFSIMLSFIDQEDIYNLLISRTPMALSRALSNNFKQRGIPISKEQFSILVILWKKEGCSQQYLAEETYRDKPGITRLIDTLEREKLVVRKADPHDRRSNLIYLTEKGKELEGVVTESVRDTLNIAAKGLSEEDAKNLKRILEIVFKNLQ